MIDTHPLFIQIYKNELIMYVNSFIKIKCFDCIWFIQYNLFQDMLGNMDLE